MNKCRNDTIGTNWCHTHHSLMPSDSKQCHLARAIVAEKAIKRVEALQEQWHHNIVATLGKPLPGGVLTISLQSADYQLSRALKGDNDG